MIRLYGIAVSPGDARSLVATLLADEQPHCREAAVRIADALERGAKLLALSTEERTAIFAALEDPPEGGLAELRGVLASARSCSIGRFGCAQRPLRRRAGSPGCPVPARSAPLYAVGTLQSRPPSRLPRGSHHV